MSNIRICDICGEQIKPRQRYYEFSSQPSEKRFEMCEECYDKFRTFAKENSVIEEPPEDRLKFKGYGKMSSDCTMNYNVYWTGELTVKEFIDCVLTEKPKESGYIGIENGKAIFGDPKIEYQKGEIIEYNTAFNELGHKKVKEAWCNGGYSRMDYRLILED